MNYAVFFSSFNTIIITYFWTQIVCLACQFCVSAIDQFSKLCPPSARRDTAFFWQPNHHQDSLSRYTSSTYQRGLPDLPFEISLLLNSCITCQGRVLSLLWNRQILCRLTRMALCQPFLLSRLKMDTLDGTRMHLGLPMAAHLPLYNRKESPETERLAPRSSAVFNH